MSSDESEAEFVVGKILNHRLFDRLVDQTRDGRCRFLPETIREDRNTHPKYGYLVHWLNFPKRERSWEPESLLSDVELLKQYKRDHGLPPVMEKINKFYGQKTWRDLTIASDKIFGSDKIDHLLTKEERERRAQKALLASNLPPPTDPKEVKSRLEELNNKHKEMKKEKQDKRVRMDTPEDPEEEARRKRRQEREEQRRKEAAKEGITFEQYEERRRKKKEEKKLKDRQGTSSSSYGLPIYRIPKKTSAPQMAPSSSSASLVSRTKSVEEIHPLPAKISSSFSTDSKGISRPTALPGITRLDANTPRIQKKKPVVGSLEEVSTPQCAQATRSIGTPQPLVESNIMNVSLKRSDSVICISDGPMEKVKAVVKETNKASSSQSAPTINEVAKQKLSPVEAFHNLVLSSDEEDEPMDTFEQPIGRKRRFSEGEIEHVQWPVEPEETEDEPMETEESENEEAKLDEERAEKLRKEKKMLKVKRDRLPKRIRNYRRNRQFATTLNLRKLRRTQSAEQLSAFWNTNAEMEIVSKNFEGSHGMHLKNEIPIEKKFPEEPSDVRVPKKLTEEERYQINATALVEMNWKNVCKAVRTKNLDKSIMNWLRVLTEYFSRDQAHDFEKTFKKKMMAAAVFDPVKLLAIMCMTSQCKHPLWDQDPQGFTLVESDDSQTHEAVRFQQTYCNESHRKCFWMELFMKLLPQKFRFLERDDAPFRDDVFAHCMQNGAECQKDLFFKYNKPIGIQEFEVGEYSIDAMHMLATQYGSIGRLRWYMSIGGLDINAIATHTPTQEVFRLYDWLNDWIRDNVVDEEDDRCFAVFYSARLLNTVKGSAEALEQLVQHRVEKMISSRMNSRWSAHIDVTWPHLIRCSPLNNESNGGDGTHQVLTCLFLPQAKVGYRNGACISEISDEKKRNEAERLKRVVDKFSKWVGDDTGRLILALFRVDIPYRKEADNQKFVTAEYKLVESDEGFDIEKMTILRQCPDLRAEEADLDMIEIPSLASPGCRYFGIENENVEKKYVVPGNAHIEITGEVSEPITFVAQLFFFKKVID